MTMPTAELIAFRKFARSLMDDFGFADIPFKWNAATKQAGAVCYKWDYSTGVRKAVPSFLVLSRTIIMKSTWAAAEDTLRHEIAHLIAGHEAGHGPAWQAACHLTGATPKATYDPTEQFAWSNDESVLGVLAQKGANK